jgi:hypothetical protein
LYGCRKNYATDTKRNCLQIRHCVGRGDDAAVAVRE